MAVESYRYVTTWLGTYRVTRVSDDAMLGCTSWRPTPTERSLWEAAPDGMLDSAYFGSRHDSAVWLDAAARARAAEYAPGQTVVYQDRDGAHHAVTVIARAGDELTVRGQQVKISLLAVAAATAATMMRAGGLPALVDNTVSATTREANGKGKT